MAMIPPVTAINAPMPCSAIRWLMGSTALVEDRVNIDPWPVSPRSTP